MMPDRGRPPLWPAVLLPMLLCGCPPQISDIEQTNRLEVEVASLKQDLVARDETIRRQAEQIRALQSTGLSGRLDLLPHAARIEIDALSGGYDDDDKPGDDGVVVYLRTYDQAGDLIKAAGSAGLKVFDLAADESGRLIGELTVEAADLPKTWYGKLLTSHYTLRCPWKSGPPPRTDVTVRVLFNDLVTGRAFEQVKAVKVALPPRS